MQPIIALVQIEKSYPQKMGPPIDVLDGLSLAFGKGEITAILGPTGCGKTTILSLINGLVSPDAGYVEFSAERESLRIGTVLQKDLLLPWRNVKSNAVLGLEIAKHKATEVDLRGILREFELNGAEGMYPDQLSGGMRKKLSILRTLLFDPNIVLFDEPFANIDYYLKLELESFCAAWIRRKNSTGIYVTHDVEEAIAVADRIIVLSNKPAHVMRDFSVVLSREAGSDPISARRAPEFRAYFETIWDALKRES